MYIDEIHKYLNNKGSASSPFRSGCPVSCALDLVGDAWSLIVIRDLMFEEKHTVAEILAGEEGASRTTITSRLNKLEAAGMVGWIVDPQFPRRRLYYLKPMGKDLIHVMIGLMCWSNGCLRDALGMSAERRMWIERDPEGFKRLTLSRLDVWERQNLGL